MSKKFRLTRADMSAANASRRFHGAFFSLAVSPLSRERRSSFACVVSRSVALRAVRRNLVKRRCREAVRARMRTFSEKSPLALVFRAKKSAASATFAAIREDIGALFDKVRDVG